MASHRRWRVFCHQSANTSYMGIAELRLYDATNTLVTGGTASANDVFSSPTYDASMARDGNTSTFWSTSGSFPQNGWLAIDFGSGNDKDIRRIEIDTPLSTGYDITPTSFEVQFSDDNVTWTSMRKFVYQWPSAGTRSFDLVPAPDYDAPFWRIFVRASANITFASIAEFRLYDQSNTAITGGTPTSDRQFSGTYDAAKARDGNNATYWASQTSLTYGSWLTIDFGADKSVSRIELQPIPSPDYDQTPSAFSVESSVDGESWDVIASHSYSWANDTFQSFVVYTPPSGGARRRPVNVNFGA